MESDESTINRMVDTHDSFVANIVQSTHLKRSTLIGLNINASHFIPNVKLNHKIDIVILGHVDEKSVAVRFLRCCIIWVGSKDSEILLFGNRQVCRRLESAYLCL